MTMNWHDTVNATQNRTQWRELIYKAVENRKRLMGSKTLFYCSENPMGSPVVASDLKEPLLVPADKGRTIVAIDKNAFVHRQMLDRVLC
jgi:hypothetical protein